MSDTAEANTLDLQTAASLLQLSERRIQQLAKEGWFATTERGRYPLVPLVRGYIRFLKEENARQAKSAAEGRLKDVKAREVEMRIARADREVIDLAEAMEAVSGVAGECVAEFEGLPARITRNVRERQRIRDICDEARQRLADRFAQIARGLRSGVADHGAAAEDDA